MLLSYKRMYSSGDKNREKEECKERYDEVEKKGEVHKRSMVLARGQVLLEAYFFLANESSSSSSSSSPANKVATTSDARAFLSEENLPAALMEKQLDHASLSQEALLAHLLGDDTVEDNRSPVSHTDAYHAKPLSCSLREQPTRVSPSSVKKSKKRYRLTNCLMSV